MTAPLNEIGPYTILRNAEDWTAYKAKLDAAGEGAGKPYRFAHEHNERGAIPFPCAVTSRWEDDPNGPYTYWHSFYPTERAIQKRDEWNSVVVSLTTPPGVPAPVDPAPAQPDPDDPRVGDIIVVENQQGKPYAGLVVGIRQSSPKAFRTRFWEGDRNWVDLIPADQVKGVMRRLPGDQWPGRQKNQRDCWQREYKFDLPGLWNQAIGLSGLIGDGVLEWHFTSHYTYVRLAESKENTVMPPKPEETPVAQPAPAPTAFPTLPLTLPHSQLPALIRGLVEQTNRPALQSTKLFFRRGIKDFQTPEVVPKNGPPFLTADRYYPWQGDGSLAVYELLMVPCPPGGERASVVLYLGVVLPENWTYKA